MKQGSHGGGWTDDRTILAEELWREGKSASEVAKALKVSRNAVIGKLHRLKLAARDLPSRPKVAKGRAPKPAPSSIRVGSNNARTYKLAPSVPLPKLRVVESGAPSTLADRPAGCCCYPVSGDGADTLFCCAPVKTPGHSWQYCSAHLTLMTAKSGKGAFVLKDVKRRRAA